MSRLSVAVSSAEGKKTGRFPEKSPRYRDSLKSEVRLPRDQKHFRYESNEQKLTVFLQLQDLILCILPVDSSIPPHTVILVPTDSKSRQHPRQDAVLP
jgi:hypothetical protein